MTAARKGSAFAGLSVAVVTPFRDGEVDYEALRRQIDFQVQAGTKCVCPVGTTGESPTLSHDEHERVISDPGAPVIIGASSLKTPVTTADYSLLTKIHCFASCSCRS